MRWAEARQPTSSTLKNGFAAVREAPFQAYSPKIVSAAALTGYDRAMNQMPPSELSAVLEG